MEKFKPGQVLKSEDLNQIAGNIYGERPSFVMTELTSNMLNFEVSDGYTVTSVKVNSEFCEFHQNYNRGYVNVSISPATYYIVEVDLEKDEITYHNVIHFFVSTMLFFKSEGSSTYQPMIFYGDTEDTASNGILMATQINIDTIVHLYPDQVEDLFINNQYWGDIEGEYESSTFEGHPCTILHLEHPISYPYVWTDRLYFSIGKYIASGQLYDTGISKHQFDINKAIWGVQNNIAVGKYIKIVKVADTGVVADDYTLDTNISSWKDLCDYLWQCKDISCWLDDGYQYHGFISVVSDDYADYVNLIFPRFSISTNGNACITYVVSLFYSSPYDASNNIVIWDCREFYNYIGSVLQTNVPVGSQAYDTSTNQPKWWNGTDWAGVQSQEVLHLTTGDNQGIAIEDVANAKLVVIHDPQYNTDRVVLSKGDIDTMVIPHRITFSACLGSYISDSCHIDSSGPDSVDVVLEYD